ncbi:MAG: hypothetical protein COB14_01685 [Alphaproteobacteria bacterium]|nr:MAG: hypothetical protein COB14_01685 [Alphaproteobacteria bacterium]
MNTKESCHSLVFIKLIFSAALACFLFGAIMPIIFDLILEQTISYSSVKFMFNQGVFLSVFGLLFSFPTLFVFVWPVSCFLIRHKLSNFFVWLLLYVLAATLTPFLYAYVPIKMSLSSTITFIKIFGACGFFTVIIMWLMIWGRPRVSDFIRLHRELGD